MSSSLAQKPFTYSVDHVYGIVNAWISYGTKLWINEIIDRILGWV
jgi:hypothetical protein